MSVPADVCTSVLALLRARSHTCSVGVHAGVGLGMPAGARARVGTLVRICAVP